MNRRRRFKRWKPRPYKRARNERRFKAKVQRIISQADESKYIDTELNSDQTPVGGTGVVTPLTLSVQGSSDDNRNGDEIKLTSVEMKYHIEGDPTGSTYDTLARIMIVRAKKNIQGVLPTILEILKTDSVTSLRATTGGADMSDFKVYYDKLHVIPRTLTNVLPQTVIGKFYKSLGGLKCTYNASALNITTCETGHLFLVRITNQVINESPFWSVDVRVRFKEI